MIPLILSLCLFLFIPRPSTAQPTASTHTAYANFVIDGKQVWLLTRAGTVDQVDLQSGKPVQQAPKPSFSAVAITKDRQGHMIAGDSSQQLWQLDRTKRVWSPVNTYTGKLTGLVHDRKNRCFAITNRGIMDVSTHTVYFPDSALYLNDQIRNKRAWFGKPTYMLDKRDRIWLGFGYGEWGGDVFVFDTGTLTFVRPQLHEYPINMNPVQSFAESDTSVFMTTGMAHFETHGSIVRFDKLSATVVLQSNSYWKPVSASKQTRVGGEYIGPTAVNPKDKSLYFYSQHGIFRGDPTRDLSQLKNWSLIAKPGLTWTGGQPNAVGPAMNVLKMAFTPKGTLLLLTEHNGLGVFNGKSFQFITSRGE